LPQAAAGGAGGAGVSNAGTITSLNNSGAITGGNGGAGTTKGGAGGAGVSNAGTIKTLTNSGTITGGNGGSGAAQGGAGGTGLANTGTITTLTNIGTISNGGPGADAILSAGANASIETLTNTGHIIGAVDLLGGSGDSLDNLGSISGNIALAGGDVLNNQGQVYGDVTLAGGDTLIDSGLIHGDVTLGQAASFDTTQGGVAGTIRASSGDLFEFGGHFGAETIDGFTAGAGSTHDTLEFAASDFASYAVLTRAMSEVGSDVTIRLDATDSITLNHVSLSSLVSADFKFG
jgi:hypothetical protein